MSGRAVTWICERCGKAEPPNGDVWMYTIGRLGLGTLHAHTYCPDHVPKTTAEMQRCATCSGRER